MVIANKKKENTFILVTLSAYIVIGLIGVFHHEVWRDELQTWLVGAASNSLGTFLHNMKTECNPLMWYSINFILSRFTASPVAAQIFHLLISSGSVYLILKYAPFSHLQKVLLSFSYFILFEYTLIARGYALTIFFAFLFCSFYQTKSKNRYILLSLILFLLPNTTGLHGVIVTISMLVMMVADYYFSEDISIRKKYTQRQLFFAVIVALLGVYIAIKCISPVANSDRSNTWFIAMDTERLAIALRTFWMSFIPIPNFQTIHYWNTNFFYKEGTSSFTFAVLLILSLIIFSYCILLYSKKLSIALLYLTATCGILLACYTNNVIFWLSSVRHYGFLFITFIVAAWLSPNVMKSTFIIPGLSFLGDKLKVEKNFTYLLTTLLAINMLGGIIAYGKDFYLPFSEIEQTANYITNHHLDKLPELGFPDFTVSPLSAYTHQPIYFPDRDTTGRFTTWGTSRYSFDTIILLKRTIDFLSRQKDSALFIPTGDYLSLGDGKVVDNIKFTQIASFFGGTVRDEHYILYIAVKLDINKLLQDSTSFQNQEKINTLVSAANDLLQNNRPVEAEKILVTIDEKTHGRVVQHLHNYLGIAYSKENRPGDAEKEFKTEIALNLQKEEAFLNLGILYSQNKDYANAINSWDSTLNINPKNADALNNLGLCYLNFKNNPDRAKVYFEKVVELRPDYIQGYYNVLVCAQSSNDEELFIKYIRIMLDKGISINNIKAQGINISDTLLQKINSR